MFNFLLDKEVVFFCCSGNYYNSEKKVVEWIVLKNKNISTTATTVQESQ